MSASEDSTIRVNKHLAAICAADCEGEAVGRGEAVGGGGGWIVDSSKMLLHI